MAQYPGLLQHDPPMDGPQQPQQPEGQFPAGMSVEAMFRVIMESVGRSQSEIAELRQTCSDLRDANSHLERQVRESLSHSLYLSSPGTVPSSPTLRARSSFLRPTAPPSIYVPPPPVSNPTTSSRRPEIPGFWAVVPAGGAGTRLWPLSREGCPKFLLDLTQQGRSLIQSTWDRLMPLTTPDRLMVVTGRAHTPGVSEQLPDLLSSNLLSEPSPKESMAAIGLAAAVLVRRDKDAIIGSFAADHMISGIEAFSAAVGEAVATAKHDYLVTIGIAPSGPATGFGYIKLGDKLDIQAATQARAVVQFKEKPDARTAMTYLQAGGYLWNGGMFVVKASILLDLLQENQPLLHDGLQEIAEAWDTDARDSVLDSVWPTLPKIAIDHAIAEPAAVAGRVAVVPATFGWDDVGDFSSLADMLPAESNQPRILGDGGNVVTHQVAGGIIVPGSGRLIAALGVDDLVIVDTPDALLVTTRARSQEVKRIVGRVRESGWKATL